MTQTRPFRDRPVRVISGTPSYPESGLSDGRFRGFSGLRHSPSRRLLAQTSPKHRQSRFRGIERCYPVSSDQVKAGWPEDSWCADRVALPWFSSSNGSRRRSDHDRSIPSRSRASSNTAGLIGVETFVFCSGIENRCRLGSLSLSTPKSTFESFA